MKPLVLLSIFMFFFVGCLTAPQEQIKQSPIENPTLKLRIEGVESVKVAPAPDESDLERQRSMEDKKLAMELEKWAYEKAEKDRALIKSKMSAFCNFELTYPTFDLYSTITMQDWRNIQKDFEVLTIMGYDTVVLRIFSGGGSAFAGLGIADALKEWEGKGLRVIGKAYGIIASATVPIFASCTERISAASTLFMVHEASMFKFFTTESHSDITAQKQMLDKMQDKYCELLAKNSNKPAAFWKALEEKTTWFDADKAKAWGLVDEIE